MKAKIPTNDEDNGPLNVLLAQLKRSERENETESKCLYAPHTSSHLIHNQM